MPYLANCQQLKHLLKVAIIGAPNAGKSTLLNRLIGQEISCVSKKVHTTRKNVLGVYTRDSVQLEFYDSPGLVTKAHVLKHRLEKSLLIDPENAAVSCDLMAVVVDASNIREQQKLNKGVLEILEAHQDKQSILILNKVDLIKDKRLLLDVSTRLTDGKIRHLSRDSSTVRPKHKYVIELKKSPEESTTASTAILNQTHIIPTALTESQGYGKFSQIFSISALNDDGIEEIREHMLDLAKPVEQWPHGPDYVTNQNSREIVHGIIRGKVMDYVENAVPYLLNYKYLYCNYDEFGSLHVQLSLRCPEKYMVSKVLGEKGIIITRIIQDSRETISKTLACDVKLNILVEAVSKKKALSK